MGGGERKWTSLASMAVRRPWPFTAAERKAVGLQGRGKRGNEVSGLGIRRESPAMAGGETPGDRER
ncbi:hypothetical protein E2562_000019 [Oryza meyeriana var. granulata]|uniref:Uncharacterized protein n=1 Tax=Oryza meyeriana var. granulata TaxID=110450 RepID=A0A6G1DB34_9ORYZ|nr:hypothetical protein E2562_000019 [Oryza meyeriana var. granulata]